MCSSVENHREVMDCCFWYTSPSSCGTDSQDSLVGQCYTILEPIIARVFFIYWGFFIYFFFFFVNSGKGKCAGKDGRRICVRGRWPKDKERRWPSISQERSLEQILPSQLLEETSPADILIVD